MKVSPLIRLGTRQKLSNYLQNYLQNKLIENEISNLQAWETLNYYTHKLRSMFEPLYVIILIGDLIIPIWQVDFQEYVALHWSLVYTGNLNEFFLMKSFRNIQIPNEFNFLQVCYQSDRKSFS